MDPHRKTNHETPRNPTLNLLHCQSRFAGGPVTRGQRVYRESHCYENVEQYIPGYYNKHGQYVGGYVKHRRNKIPCGYAPVRNYHAPSYHQPGGNVDNNDCSGGTDPVGALLGGGLAGFGSRGKDRWWAIPAGVVGGAMLGCQVDGG